MKIVDKVYINGKFITPNGTDVLDLISPATQKKIGSVVLGDEIDTRNAIAAANKALVSFSKTTASERIEYLDKLHTAVHKRRQELIDTMILEYGSPIQFTTAIVDFSMECIQSAKRLVEGFDFEPKVGNTKVRLEPVGVAGIITPWNANYVFLLNKLSMVISAGCTAVVKPSELSALQTQVLLEAIDEAGLPEGVINIVNGYGTVVGNEISINKGINKISFTGSTAVGKSIAAKATESLKRTTLELGGKSPNIILEDADLSTAIPFALGMGFASSGQICTAGTRILVPEAKLEEVKAIIKENMGVFKPGLSTDPNTVIGPLVSKKQYDSVQNYIQSGIDQGAELLTGGVGHPEGLEQGNYVKPTIFIATNDLKVSQEEIFGPVLVLITYKDEADAIAIANDTEYGLAAYVQGKDEEKAYQFATQIEAGYITVNSAAADTFAPFGGVKQSGMGREFGPYGLEAYLEPKAILR